MKSQERKLDIAETRMVWWIDGVTRKDMLRNDYIRGTVKVGSLVKKVEGSGKRWIRDVW